MSIVRLQVNGRDYHLDCSEDQRPRLERLARIVEDRALSLAESGGAEAGAEGEEEERRFLLLTSLLLADRLLEAEVRAVELEETLSGTVRRAQLAPPSDPDPEPSLADLPPALADAMASLLDSASERIEALCARLERA